MNHVQVSISMIISTADNQWQPQGLQNHFSVGGGGGGGLINTDLILTQCMSNFPKIWGAIAIQVPPARQYMNHVMNL